MQQLGSFVPDLLQPKNLIVKEIGARSVTGRQLLEFFKVCINVFAGELLLEIVPVVISGF